jgi:GNAT superfamily N-acetyltransferase
VNLGDLETTDETTVKRWLNPYLTQHLAWWTAAYGTVPRHSVGVLVSREWDDLIAGSRTPEHFVCVAENTQPLGVVYARLREDRYLGVPVGVLSWLYVTEEARGKGVSSLLMEAANSWMAAQEVLGCAVFVTAENAPALKLYKRFGYRAVDARMLGAAPRRRAPTSS